MTKSYTSSEDKLLEDIVALLESNDLPLGASLGLVIKASIAT